MPEAKKYVALENFKFRGVDRKKGDVFRITDEKAVKLGGKVKLADEATATPAPAAPSGQTAANPLPQKTMSQYKVKEAFELEGVNQEVDSVVELTDEKAAELGTKVEKVEASSEAGA